MCGSHSGNGRSGGVGVVPNSRFSHHHPAHPPPHLHGHPPHPPPHPHGQGVLAFSNDHFHFRKASASGLTVVPTRNFTARRCRGRVLLTVASPITITPTSVYSALDTYIGQHSINNTRTISLNECEVAHLLSFDFSKWSKRFLSLACSAACLSR